MTRHVIIRADTLAQAMNKSESIQRGIVFWLAIMVASIFAIISPDLRGDGFVFGVAIGGFIVSVASIILSALRVNNLNALIPDDDDYEPPDEPPANDASDALTFGQSHRPGNVRIEKRDGQVTTRGTIALQRRQWHALVTELAKHREGGVVGWSRRKIEKHDMPEIEGTDYDCFIGLTARNEDGETKLKVLTREFRRMGIVVGPDNATVVTDTGWVELCRLAFGDEGIVI